MSRSSLILRRVSFFLLLYICFMLLPWWVVFMLAALGTIAFSWYLESVFFMLYIDAVFSIAWFPWLGFSMLVCLLLVESVTYYISH